jgi:Zn finger protein HypA/HybF involved in hydrogenase expression
MRKRKIALFAFIACFALIGAVRLQDFPHGEMTRDCQECHDAKTWSDISRMASFDHEQTGFSLIGTHKQTKCANCHKSLVFSKIGVACADCHTDIHRGQFGLSCQNCHSPQNWQNKQDIFKTHSQRGFPLVGVHSAIDCDACHINQQRNEYAGTPTECKGCHESDFRTADNPNHLKAGFQSDCRECHRPLAASWQNVNYEHPAAFQLQGAHVKLDCRNCHTQVFAGLSHECLGCHNNDYQASENPPHVSLGFPTNCLICHDQSQWASARFNHIQASGYELRGAHANVGCVDCHANNQYAGLPHDCYGCHQNDFAEVVNPNHTQGGFSHDCLGCHSEMVWNPATFDHNQLQFPLSGGHGNLQCIQCHSQGYQNTPRECYACHQNDYNNVADPNHAQNNFNHDCTQCHTISAWQPATFDHAQTLFPLTGAHITTLCIQCHSAGYQNTPSECYACHLSDYNNVADPNHVQNNFNHDCTQCHSTAVWDPSTFNHNQTAFPLTGAHISLQCVSCHANGYAGTPTDCYTCHLSDYNNVADPNHVQNNFNHDCTQCHSTAVWDPSTFNHNQTAFPLTGAHTSLQCVSCHANGYAGTPTDCYACHQNDYNGATNPNHPAAGFPHDCQSCHSTNNWNQTTYNHDSQFFRIYSGRHQGQWTLCADCHTNPNNFAVFECINCHEHNRLDTDNRHLEVPNYQYLSSACYTCHRSVR